MQQKRTPMLMLQWIVLHLPYHCLENLKFAFFVDICGYSSDIFFWYILAKQFADLNCLLKSIWNLNTTQWIALNLNFIASNFSVRLHIFVSCIGFQTIFQRLSNCFKRLEINFLILNSVKGFNFFLSRQKQKAFEFQRFEIWIEKKNFKWWWL